MMYNGTISVVTQAGARFDGIQAYVSSKSITTDNTTHAIEDGDTIIRELPGGPIDRFLVLDNGYHGQWGGQKAYYSIKYRKINNIPPESPQTVIYNLHGANSRVNNQSHDQSVNIVNTTAAAMFDCLRKALQDGVRDEADLSKLLARVDAMEEDQGTPTFLERYQEFILAVGAYMAIATPFIPALTQLLR